MMPINKKVKTKGVVYTPSFWVDIILDQAGYYGKEILQKHVIDNSCGNGVFLKEIVKRYIEVYFIHNTENNLERLKNELETYIHGIDIDGTAISEAIESLNDVVMKVGLTTLNWDIKKQNALKTNEYNNKMDFVVGNPPYVKVHNLEEYDAVRNGKFTKKGMTDLFIIFYEIGLNMLNENGVLCYITPSSLHTSKAGKDIRKHFIEEKLLTSVLNLEHFQAFKNITTYTSILKLDKGNNDDVLLYSVFDPEKGVMVVDNLKYDDIFIEGCFYFGNRRSLDVLKDILETDIKKKDIEIKNGYATLSDKTFIRETFDFKSKMILDVFKASNGKWYKMIFPYNQEGKRIDFAVFDSNVQKHLINNKTILEKRSLSKGTLWYEFGRSQAIKDTFLDKLSVNTIVKSADDLKLTEIPSGSGVFSGLYIIGNVDLSEVKNILENEMFFNYLKLLGKYKSGGYYSFSSMDLKRYLYFHFQNKTYTTNKFEKCFYHDITEENKVSGVLREKG